MRILAIVFFSLYIFSCSGVNKKSPDKICFQNDESSKSKRVDFAQVYKSDSLNGKTIMIDGYFAYSFEDIALYPSKSANPSRAIWLRLSSELIKRDSALEKIKGKKVSVIGIFNANDKGHLGSYFGSLVNVSCVLIE